MQMPGQIYTDEVIQSLITVVLFCLNCAAAGAAVRFACRRISLLKWVTFTLISTIMGYIVSSALLLTFNWFSVFKALLLALILTVLIIAGILWRNRKRGLPVCGELEGDLRPYLPLIFLIILGLVISWGNFGYFGMGQDQGVYQDHAINLIYGQTDRIYRFDEYNKLDTDEEKEAYYINVRDQLLGLELIDNRPEENAVLSGLRNGGDDSHEHTDSIFHGIPTWPALLALWGTMTGLANMGGIQTLIYLLSIMMLWFTAENLRLKKWTTVMICLIWLLSPENVWVSKSTLTEELLALVIICFTCLLTNPEHPEHRWYSAGMVCMFAVVHVSVFVMIPMFFALYILLYLWKGDKQYLRALMVSALGFMAGFTFMTLVSPRYTIRNTAMLWVGPVRLENIYWVLMAFGFAGILLSVFLRHVPVKGRFRSFLQANSGGWTLRGLIVLMLALSVVTSLVKGSDSDFDQTLVSNGMYNMCWMTGLIFLPVSVIALLRKPKEFLQNEVSAGLTFLFGYAVLLMCAFMKSEIQYCYYYGRYLTPYIPVACIMIGLIWNRYSGKAVCAGIVVGSLVSVPFDMTMIYRQDDTLCTYETFSHVIDSVQGVDAAVIFDNHQKMFMLPVKAITGNDCYFGEEDVNRQAMRLAKKYTNVFCVTGSEMDWNLVTKINDTAYVDDNHSFRYPACPFPTSFRKIPYHYNVYTYKKLQVFTASDLTSVNPPENGIIILPPGYTQQGPFVPISAGEYEVHYYGSNLADAVCYPAANDGVMLDNTIIQQNDEEVILQFTADYDLTSVEFITKNWEEYPVSVEFITLTALSGS